MDYSVLSQSPLFKGINSQEISEILATLQYRIRRYTSGSIISQSGEVVNSLMIVIIGTVKGEMVDYSGRIIKIEDISAPGALAPAFLFGSKNRFPVNVVSISDSELLTIEKSELLRLLMSNSIILGNFLDMISNRSQFLSEKIKFLNFKTIRGKLAQYILHISGNQKGLVRLNKTQNELADFFGVARPSIARALNELEEEGYLEAKGKIIRVLDKNGLINLTSERVQE
jgi:CRP/FNR family transcriptional regulator, dissimilatory nitrate respiration regulator